MRQANQGLHVNVRAPFGRDDVILDVVPDLVELDELAVRQLAGSFPASATVLGGDVRAICAAQLGAGADCLLGFNIIVVSADTPVDLTSEIGLARSGVGGVFGCGREPHAFDASARVDVAFD